MSDTQDIRASDRDREQVVDRLRDAVGDGRLSMDEYMERMELAYQAVTHSDLTPLYADLPAADPRPEVTEPPAAPAAVTPSAGPARTGVVAGLPCCLKCLWRIWLSAVSINVVVWVLVTATTGHLVYPWPLWVAGPFGAALFAMSVGVTRLRASRPAAPGRMPVLPGKG